MKELFILASILIFTSSSFGSAKGFRYDLKTGDCKDAHGNLGWNAPDLSMVFTFDPGKDLSSDSPSISGKKLECADATNVTFRERLQSNARYVELKNWNLKGADLSGSDISWMVFVKGSLEGADLTKTHIGYTQFRSVRVDSHTKGLPPQCLETAVKNTINCQK